MKILEFWLSNGLIFKGQLQFAIVNQKFSSFVKVPKKYANVKQVLFLPLKLKRSRCCNLVYPKQKI